MSLFGNLGVARDLDAGVRAQLADSLAYIAGEAGSYLEVDHTGLHSAGEQIRARQQDPGIFARYFDLILAINSNRFSEANTLLAELIDRALQPVSFAIVPYRRDELGSDFDRFPKLLFAEFSIANPMASPSPSEMATATRQLRHAIETISRVDPAVSDEIEAFLTRIYVTRSSEDARARRLGGTTSLMTWGGSFVNLDAYKSGWDAVQFLVHEITHSLLFSLDCVAPLVENSPDENYPSPLRPDPRPMDGIFHATLVCARLAEFNRDWLDSGLGNGADRELSESSVARNTRLFHDGLAIVRQHAKLSAQAVQLVEESAAAMSVLA